MELAKGGQNKTTKLMPQLHMEVTGDENCQQEAHPKLLCTLHPETVVPISNSIWSFCFRGIEWLVGPMGGLLIKRLARLYCWLANFLDGWRCPQCGVWTVNWYNILFMTISKYLLILLLKKEKKKNKSLKV